MRTRKQAPGPKAAAPPAKTPRWTWVLAALIVFGAYLPTIRYSFLLDDFLLFKDSPTLRSLSSIPLAFTQDMAAHRTDSSRVQSSYYRPVFLTLATLYYQAVGPSPTAWHLASAVLAAGVAALAVLFFGLLGFPPGRAFLAGLVFALHPSHVSSIAWVSGLQEQLAAGFVLLALLALLSPRAPLRPKLAVTVSTLCFALALLCKEVALALLPMTVAWLLLAPAEEQRRRFLLRPAIASFSVVAAGYLAIRILVLGTIAKPYWEAPSFAQAVWSLPLTLLTYVHLLILPVSYSFVRPERPSPGPFDALTVACLAGSVLLLALAWVVTRRKRELALPLAWFLIWLLPVMNVWALFPEWMVTDRYLYLPSLALPWLLGVALPRRESAPALAVVAVLLGLLTLRYSAVFVDAKTLTDALLEVDKTSSWMLEEKARMALEQRKYAAAEALFRRALELDPVDAYSLYYVGSFERDRGEFRAARQHFRQALVEQPEKSLPFTSLAYAMAVSGQRSQALALLRETIWRWPAEYEPRALQIALLANDEQPAGAAEALAAAQRTWPGQPEIAGTLDEARSRLASRFRLDG